MKVTNRHDKNIINIDNDLTRCKQTVLLYKLTWGDPTFLLLVKMPFSKEDKLLIKHYRSKDLDPMDYGIWSTMEVRINFNKIKNLQELKDAIVGAWESSSQETMDKMIGAFRKRAKTVILEKGDQSNHLLYDNLIHITLVVCLIVYSLLITCKFRK